MSSCYRIVGSLQMTTHYFIQMFYYCQKRNHYVTLYTMLFTHGCEILHISKSMVLKGNKILKLFDLLCGAENNFHI
jgi:hypothetical protein